jgi:NADH-quinone oxidoreductase subunit G
MGLLTVNGQTVEFTDEKNILEVIRKAGIEVPTFCYFSELSVYGACRMCSVEIEGRGIVASCSTPPEEGMVIETNTARTLRLRKMVLELLLANHQRDCTTCEKNGSCKLQSLCYQLGVREVRFGKRKKQLPIDTSSPAIIRNENKCILCGDCVRVCAEVQGIGAISFAGRGPDTVVSTAFGKNLADVECINCGQCVAVCPTAALTAKPETDFVWKALHTPGKTVVAQVAPAVRVALGELFGFEPGALVTGRLVAGLKKLGFDKVFDTVFSADLTAVEECAEFLHRFKSGGKLPLFTSCCPGWVKYAEQYHPDLLDNLSTCKSPQQMFGALIKNYYAPKINCQPEDLIVVSIMPCTAKKFEARREEFVQNGIREVDAVITVNELAMLVKQAGISFDHLEEEPFDQPFGFTTGGGTIFGVTGGVAEAVLRTAAGLLNLELEQPDFRAVRGFAGLKEAEVNLQGTRLKLAVVNGLGNAAKLIDDLENKKASYDLVEVMACPGGCIGGGGQPVPNSAETRLKRSKALYRSDKLMQLRSPHDNLSVRRLYEDYLHTPGSKQAHALLHTSYHPRHRLNGVHSEKKNKRNLEISVCVGTGCYLRGAYDVMQKLHQIVKREGLGQSLELKATFCLERCDKGVSIKVGDQILTGVSPENLGMVFQRQIKPLIERNSNGI